MFPLFNGFSGFDAVEWGRIARIVGIALLGLIIFRAVLAMVSKYRKILISNLDNQPYDPNAKRIETISAILRNAAGVVTFLITLFMILSEVGINIAPLIAGAGIAGIAIGFGAQSLVKDLFSGFFILFENQFGIGDIIQVGESSGQVEQMTLRTVHLRDLDGRVHIIPNGEIHQVIVYTKDWSRMNLNVEVAYRTNLERAFALMKEINQQFYQQHPDLLLEEPELLGVESLGSNGISIKVVGKTLPLKQWEAARCYRKAIKEAFDQAGIEIPFPQRVVHVSQPTENPVTSLLWKASNQSAPESPEEDDFSEPEKA